MVVGLLSFREVKDNDVVGESAGEGEAMTKDWKPGRLRAEDDEREY